MSMLEVAESDFTTLLAEAEASEKEAGVLRQAQAAVRDEGYVLRRACREARGRNRGLEGGVGDSVGVDAFRSVGDHAMHAKQLRVCDITCLHSSPPTQLYWQFRAPVSFFRFSTLLLLFAWA